MLSADWLAGFFDGEGCVGITVRGKARQVSLRITITNTDRDVLQQIHQSFGGRVLPPKPTRKGWKPYSAIIWQGPSECSRLLDVLVGRVVLKRPQVLLAREFLAFQAMPRRQRCMLIDQPTARMPHRKQWVRKPETVDRERAFKCEMHALNKKGGT